jgi:glutathione S-transferase
MKKRDDAHLVKKKKNNMILLLGHQLSQPSRAVEILLIELQVPYRLLEVGFLEGATREEWFLKINPAHSVPTIIDDDEEGDGDEEERRRGFVVYESHAIMRYLCRKFGSTNEGKGEWYPTENPES